MDDTISRQAAIDYIKSQRGRLFKGFTIEEAVLTLIREVPSVQPEIIRCKDCKHQVKEWREDKRFKDDGYWVYGCEVIGDVCGYWALFGHNDEFCSEAEPKGEQE